jgi:hypothetical protein
MSRLNKLDTDVELEIVPNQQPPSNSPSSSSGLSVYGSQTYDSYGKEYYFQGSKHREIVGADPDDPFLRPPLWEDITSSIQNIDPENAIMLGALTGATQVKLEANDDTFLEQLSSPLLSPLEIKTEKGYPMQSPQHNNNNTIHLHPNHMIHNNNNNNSYLQSSYHPHQQPHPNHLNGYQDISIQQQPMPHQQHQNYYSWTHNQQAQQHQSHHQQLGQPHQQPHVYNNIKYSPQNNICTPISRLMYAPPLTPPSSDPGSPGNSIQVSLLVLSHDQR